MQEQSRDLFPLLYFGPFGYYYKLGKATSPCFCTSERFSKQTLRNRCDLYGANGKLTLSIPVNRPFGNKTRVDEVLLSSATPWQAIHWKTIKSAYGRTPYFEHYGPKIEQLVLQEKIHLSDYLLTINKQIMEWLELPLPQLTDTIPGIVQQKELDHFIATGVYENSYGEYWQVFSEKLGFLPSLSILDILFHEGPQLLSRIHR